jgi:hypothetical protein
MKSKQKQVIDLAFVWADCILESSRLSVDKQIQVLQTWEFLQNQKYVHGVDLSKFCGAKGGFE